MPLAGRNPFIAFIPRRSDFDLRIFRSGSTFMTDAPICVTCGNQFALDLPPPALCPICDEYRQYIPPGGQAWTSLGTMAAKHRNSYRQYESGLIGIGTEPHFAIGQRALLVRTPRGNILWDCLSFFDVATAAIVSGLGGLAGIALSHPHFYGSMVEWSHAFGDAPIHIHEADREWVMRPDPVVKFWHGHRQQILDGVTLINTGGHFEGGTVLHWQGGAEGRGALLTSDIVTVAMDRRWVTFMRSYPNYIPLPARTVGAMAAMLEDVAFDRIYGGWWDTNVLADANAAVQRSAARYIEAITD
jgi:hypothetical protein